MRNFNRTVNSLGLKENPLFTICQGPEAGQSIPWFRQQMRLVDLRLQALFSRFQSPRCFLGEMPPWALDNRRG